MSPSYSRPNSPPASREAVETEAAAAKDWVPHDASDACDELLVPKRPIDKEQLCSDGGKLFSELSLEDDTQRAAHKQVPPYRRRFWKSLTAPENGERNEDVERSPDASQGRSGGKEPLSAANSEETKPVSPTGKKLPAYFSALSDDEKAVIMNHEAAKDRQRDLEAIKTTAFAICHVRSLAKLNPSEEGEMNEVRAYIDRVLRNRECGRSGRKRILDIRENMKRRAGVWANPADPEINKHLGRLFNLEDFDKLDKELAELAATIGNATIKRREIAHKACRKQRAKREANKEAEREAEPDTEPEVTPEQPRRAAKRVRFEDDETEDDARPAKRSKPASSSPQLPRTTEDKLKLLRKNLQTFDQTTTQKGDGHTPPQTPGYRVDPEGAEESEEEGYPIPENVTSSLASPSIPHPPRHLVVARDNGADMNRLEEQRQRDQDAASAAATVTASTPCPSDSSADSSSSDSSECSDSSDSSEEDTAAEASTDRRAFRYNIKARFWNVDTYTDSDEYLFKRTLKATKAQNLVTQVVEQVLSLHRPGPDAHWTLNSTWNGNLLDQHLNLHNGQHVAHAYMQREVIDLSRRAYRVARRKNLVRQRVLYTVEWSLSATPSATPDTTTTTSAAADLEYFSCVADANLRAKEVFMRWFARFFPGTKNEQYLRREEATIDQSVEDMGDMGLWQREEDMIFHGGEGGPVKEVMKVWVRKIQVMGPGN